MNFTQLKSSCIPIATEQVAVEQILPTRFSNSHHCFELREHLFYDCRFDRNGRLNSSFILNNPAYSGSILVVGKDFGLGSKVESAILAILSYGFKAVVSSRFPPNFKNLAPKMGLVLIEVSEAFLNDLMFAFHSNPSLQLNIDLEAQLLEISELNLSYKIAFNPFEMLCQMYGYH